MKLADAIRALAKPNELTPNPDPKVIGTGGARSTKVRLADGVTAKTGTPLKRREDGTYERATDAEAQLVAATFGWGGQDVHAYRSLTLDVYKNPREVGLPGWYEGDRLRIANLDEYGRPTFERDPGGRFYGLTETTVVMDLNK